MDSRGFLSLRCLLVLALASKLSCGTGESLMNCPEVPGKLGSTLQLSLASEGISKRMNKSIHILVTRAESPGNSIKKKIVSLDLPEGGSPRYLENGYKFHLENLTLRILESRRENEGWYFMTLEENFSVQHFCLQLKLYEQVSTPEIKVLNWTQENGNCSMMLACEVEKGDNVVYSWSEKLGIDPLIPANSSHLLHLSLGPQHVNNVYVCTVSNPVSNRSWSFNPWSKCRPESSVNQQEFTKDLLYTKSQDSHRRVKETKDPEVRSSLSEVADLSSMPRQWRLYAGLFLGGIVGVILIFEVVLLLLRRRGKTNHYKPTKEEKSLTIYAQVQKSGSTQKKPDPLPAEDPCTTIYVAATEPVPEPAPEPVQEPHSITVYASVTFPES